MPAYPFLSALLGGWLVGLARRRPTSGVLCAVALVVAGVLFAQLPIAGFHPFELPAHLIQAEVRWPGAARRIALLAAAAAGAGVLVLASRRWPVPMHRGVVVGLTLLLLGIGSLRVVVPLRHLGHESPMARLRERLDRDLSEGRPLEYPILLPATGVWPARHYFGYDFEIVPVEVRGRTALALYAKGDPQATRRSVSHGLRRAKQRTPSNRNR